MKKDYYDYDMAVRYVKAKKTSNVEEASKIQKEVYEQYSNLTKKMKWDLIKRLQKTCVSSENIYNLTSHYEYDVYPVLVNALDSIKLNRIPVKKDKNGKRTWKFYAAYWGYLMSYNRDFTHDIITRAKNEISIDDVSDDDSNHSFIEGKAAIRCEALKSQSPDKIYEDEITKKAFWKAVNNCLTKKFNKTQVNIWKARAEIADGKKKTIKDVCKEIHIELKDYYREMRGLKSIFKSELNACMNVAK